MAEKTPVMANRTLAYLRKFFNWCADEDILLADESLPTDRVKMPLRNEQKKRARKRYLTEDEIRVFLQATDKLAYPYGSLFQMMLYTGQRKSEVAALRWRDITGTQWLQENNKADREHIVPLADQAVAILDDLFSITGSAEGLVFHSVRSSSRKISDNTINACLRTLGYSQSEMSFHGFRAMGKDAYTSSRQPGSIDDRGVVQRVGHEHVPVSDECRNHAEVCHVSGAEDEGGRAANERGQSLLELLVQAQVSADQP